MRRSALAMLLSIHAWSAVHSAVQFGSQQGSSRPLVEAINEQQPLDGASVVPSWLAEPTTPCSEALPFVR
jgi:hypothetical protein